MQFITITNKEEKYESVMKDRLKRYDYEVLQTIRASKYDKGDIKSRKRSITYYGINKKIVQEKIKK